MISSSALNKAIKCGYKVVHVRVTGMRSSWFGAKGTLVARYPANKKRGVLLRIKLEELPLRKGVTILLSEASVEVIRVEKGPYHEHQRDATDA